MKRKARSAAVYCRISQDAKGEGLGVERQRELCERLANSLGWTVGDVYVDNDMSAYRGKPRPEYQRMVTDLRAGVRDGVIVVDQDRLVRHVRELEDFIDLADAHGIPLANVSGDLDLSTSDGRLTARIRGSVARHESEKKSERLKREREQAALKGKRHGGRRPFGYESDGITIREEEAAIVQEMARRFIAGESLPTLAADLNDRGVPTARARDLLDRAEEKEKGGHHDGAQSLRDQAEDKAWMTTSLRSILSNARIAGWRVHQGEVVAEAEWPAIIDDETYESLRTILGDTRRAQNGRPPTALLSGLARCGRCTGPLYATRASTRSARYACDSGPGRDGCGRIAVVLEPLDELVSEAVLDALSSDRLHARIDGAAQNDNTQQLVRQLAKDRDALEALARDLAEERLTRREWLAAKSVYDQRISENEESLVASNTESRLASLPRDENRLRVAWEEHDDPWKRAVLDHVLEAVIVNPAAKPGRRYFDPDRVDLRWRV